MSLTQDSAQNAVGSLAEVCMYIGAWEELISNLLSDVLYTVYVINIIGELTASMVLHVRRF